MKSYYKVPFREVYCETVRLWLASVIEIFIVYKLRTPILDDIEGDPKNE